jgi:hypothetical protein
LNSVRAATASALEELTELYLLAKAEKETLQEQH